jgi:hypothetical protein
MNIFLESTLAEFSLREEIVLKDIFFECFSVQEVFFGDRFVGEKDDWYVLLFNDLSDSKRFPSTE